MEDTDKCYTVLIDKEAHAGLATYAVFLQE